MLRLSVRGHLWPPCCILMLSLAAESAHAQCKDPSTADTCSYTGLNGGCTITVDRARPASPPTIYARRGSKITINVINPSPFETLSLDFASAKIVIQTDAFQALMSGQSGSLQKLGALASVSKVPIPGAVGFVETEEQKLARLTNSLAAISVSQRSLLSRFDISSLIPQLAKILQPPPPTACPRTSLRRWPAPSPPTRREQ